MSFTIILFCGLNISLLHFALVSSLLANKPVAQAGSMLVILLTQIVDISAFNCFLILMNNLDNARYASVYGKDILEYNFCL